MVRHSSAWWSTGFSCYTSTTHKDGRTIISDNNEDDDDGDQGGDEFSMGHDREIGRLIDSFFFLHFGAWCQVRRSMMKMERGQSHVLSPWTLFICSAMRLMMDFRVRIGLCAF